MKTSSLTTENQFSRKTYFYTIGPWVGKVHDEDDVQVLLHAAREEAEEVAAEAGVGGLVSQRGQERLQLLGGVQAGDLSGGQEAVDHVEVGRVAKVVVLHQEKDLLVLDAGRVHGHLQLVLELLHAVVAAHLEGDQPGGNCIKIGLPGKLIL